MTKVLGDIEWTRGDTFPFSIVIKESGTPVDLAGYTVELCINSEKAPADAANQLAVLQGSIDADTTTGRVTFQLSPAQADNVGQYYYDIQLKDGSGAIRTPIKGMKWKFTQDINKNV